MHSAVGVDPCLVVGSIVVPCNTEHLAKVVVEISEGRVGVHLELKFDVTIVIDKDKGRFDVKCTKFNCLSDLNQISERDSTLMC